MFVEDVQRLLGCRKLYRQDPFAVVDRFGCTLPQLRTLAVGCTVLVEERVVAVVREAEAVVLSAVPAVVEAVPVTIDPLYSIDAALGDGSLLAHLVLGVRRRLQSLHNAQADLVLRLFACSGVVRAIR